MQIKQEVTAILNKPMDRKGFLRHVAIGVVALSGAGAALRLLQPEKQKSTHTVTVVEKGYGGTAYGGNAEPKSS
ncbi:MAG: hypothetical protein JWO07_682 [Candidatus Saccharibacteria bacterium]|nr:hypothetical protein [Candidatus Saccharibacteria bacterium]